MTKGVTTVLQVKRGLTNTLLFSPVINRCSRVSFITGSYDRTCKVWDTASGAELLTLDGHRNVVYAIAFNNPYG